MTFRIERRRSFAFARRAWQQQRSTAVWLAAALGAGFGALVFLGWGGGATDAFAALVPAHGLAGVHDAAGGRLAMTSYLLTMAPAILGMFTSVVATLTLPGVVADDIDGGGIEVLLASPIPRRDLFRSYLEAGLILTSASWIVATVCFGLAAVVTASALRLDVTLSAAYLAALLVLPLAMAIWSAAATLFGALLHPGSLQSTAGMNGGGIRLLAVLPAMLLVPPVLLMPEMVLPALGVAVIVAIGGSIAMVGLTARGFRGTRVLAA